MKRIPQLLCSLVSAALIASCTSASNGEPTASHKPTTEAPRDTADKTHRPGAAVAGIAQHKSGLIKLAAVKALPSGVKNPTTGYPGRAFHAGIITDAKTWSTVQAAAGISMMNVDFNRQMVAYVILDAQTNSLGYRSWTVSGSTATLTYDWSGIEPFYRGRTPGVFAIVDRGSIKQVSFQASHKNAKPLGSVTVP